MGLTAIVPSQTASRLSRRSSTLSIIPQMILATKPWKATAQYERDSFKHLDSVNDCAESMLSNTRGMILALDVSPVISFSAWWLPTTSKLRPWITFGGGILPSSPPARVEMDTDNHTLHPCSAAQQINSLLTNDLLAHLLCPLQATGKTPTPHSVDMSRDNIKANCGFLLRPYMRSVKSQHPAGMEDPEMAAR